MSDTDLAFKGQFLLGGYEAVEINRALVDTGLPGVMFAKTAHGGVAVIIDRVVRGYLSRDEWLRIVGEQT